MLCVVKLDDPKMAGNGGVVQSVHADSDFQQAHESTMRSALGGLRVSDPALRVWRADSPLARELAARLLPGWNVDVVPMRRSVNSDGQGRKPVGELLIWSGE